MELEGSGGGMWFLDAFLPFVALNRVSLCGSQGFGEILEWMGFYDFALKMRLSRYFLRKGTQLCLQFAAFLFGMFRKALAGHFWVEALALRN